MDDLIDKIGLLKIKLAKYDESIHNMTPIYQLLTVSQEKIEKSAYLLRIRK